MSARALLTPAAKDAVRRAVSEIESRTSAEIIVMARGRSGRYREADFLGGLATGLLVLLGLLYLPPVFPLWTFAPNVLFGFGLGALVVSRSSWCRRHLTPRQVLVENVCRAARTAFVDAGYAGLPGRHAVLVYVALLERHVDVVVDLGVQHASRTTEWANACRGLDASLRQPDVGQFVTALRELGAVLARTYPRADDDRNELPDEMQHS